MILAVILLIPLFVLVLDRLIEKAEVMQAELTLQSVWQYHNTQVFATNPLTNKAVNGYELRDAVGNWTRMVDPQHFPPMDSDADSRNQWLSLYHRVNTSSDLENRIRKKTMW